MPQAARPARRKSPRPVWLLTGLAFICGGLISAAGFSIGWRNQSQRNTATETALASATARKHALERRVALLQASLAGSRTKAATAAASEKRIAGTAAKVGAEATASGGAASSVSSGAGTLTASAARLASELKTLETYLTTTPAGQLDPGYIASQTAYLTRQLTRLQAAGGDLGRAVAGFQAAVKRLAQSAATVSTG
jgi:hypothetical protein